MGGMRGWGEGVVGVVRVGEDVRRRCEGVGRRCEGVGRRCEEVWKRR